MFKKVVSIAVIIVMAMTLFAACGSQPAETPEGDQRSPAEKQKLVIWTNLTAEAQTVVLTKQFNEIAAGMGIDIEMVTVSFGDMYTKLATTMESGDVPDIMHTNFAGAAYLQGNDMIAEMSDVVDAVGRDNFIASYLHVLTADDQIWGVPDWAMHTSVWYRKDLFEEKNIKIPANWKEFEAAAKALNIDENNDGNTDVYGFPVPMNAVQVAAQTYYEFLYSAGVNTFDPDTGDYTFGKDKAKAAKVLDYMINLYKEASPPSATEWSWNEYRNALVEGTVAMTLDMGAVIGLAQSNNPDMVEKLGCFDFPGQNGTKPASFGSGYCFVASNQGSEEKVQLAKDFITKLSTPEMSAERALSRPMFAFPSNYPALEIYKQDEKVALFQNEIASITNAFENNNWYWYGMENGLSQMASQIEATTFFGEAIQSVALGEWTADEAVDYIDQNLQEQLAIINQ